MLYKGKQIKIEFKEITDQTSLRGKVWPMDFSSETEPKMSDNVDAKSTVRQRKNVPGLRQEEAVKDDPNSVADFALGRELALRRNSVSKEGEEQLSPQVDKREDHNLSQVSTGSGKFITSVRESPGSVQSEVYTPPQNPSSQSSLCVDISKKLRVKSNRGRPKKLRPCPRNPFDIGAKFKRRNVKRKGRKGNSRLRGRKVGEANYQVVPANLEGNCVKEALEILNSAEAMGLVASSNREEVLKVIVNKLEKGEI